MKQIKIISLDIENFKGIRKLNLALGGKSANLYGENATGKTSVYDALTWLLFGKDSKGNAKFSIKPLDASGNTSAGVMPTVSADLAVDGKNIRLRKQLREKWEKHRGGQERYAGNTVDYYIDDVPVKENQYKVYISELVTEETFRALTNTYRFCRDMAWKDRRSILFDLAAVASDAQLLKEARFDALRDEIGNRTVDDFRAMLAKKRKDTNSELNLLPARVDECEKQLNELPDKFDPTQRDALVDDINRLRGELVALNNDESRNAKRNEIRSVELQLRELTAENEQFRRSQDVPVVDERADLQRAIDRVKSSMRRVNAQIQEREKSIEDAEERLNYYRSQWKQENSRKYTSGACPTCGQALPADMEREAEKKFEAAKKSALDRLVADSEYVKQRAAADRESLAGLRKAIIDSEDELRQLDDRLAHAAEPQQVIIEDLPDYAECRAQMETHIAELNAALQDWDAHTVAERERLHDEIAEKDMLKAAQDKIASSVQLRQSLEKRIAEIEQEKRSKAAYIEKIDNLLDLCEDFVQFKVERVSAAVNHRFELVSFRLFTEAINGSLQDCCDAMVDGVPYNDLNSAMQINAGLDCIHTLSEFYGVKVPLFVDNAESVTKLHDMDTQVIRLIVSENDKELRCEAWA
ncbi:MAG: AAA family ATPase [Eubacteriales bacterium]|nr:AAA family ATPase [Eubacteriales bacterium]